MYVWRIITARDEHMCRLIGLIARKAYVHLDEAYRYVLVIACSTMGARSLSA